ncbi:MAG: hypothetical protein ACRYFW_06275 [Janthinobacterium lividum]
MLLALAVAIRGWDFGNPVVHVDEQWYLLVGDRMWHGAWPGIDLWDRKPPGLFAIYAAIRLLPGDGIWAYQIVATLFAAATAALVDRLAMRVGASRGAALAAGAAYLIWLPLLSGRGGESPVFYNLFVTGAALLTLRLPGLAAAEDRRGIVAGGAAACLLAGLAIQTKYTPIVEGAFFGLAHLWHLARTRPPRRVVAGAAGLWILLGAAPTLAVIGLYATRPAADFATFWFTDFGSVLLKRGFPASKIAMRLLGTTAQLSPLWLCTIASLRRERSPTMRLALGWLVAALIGFAIIGSFFDHYALPLVAPLAMLAAPTFARHARVLWLSLAAGLAVFVVKLALRPDDATGARTAAAFVAAHTPAGECPYVFAGDSITYLLAQACTPTRYAFPSTLAYAAEQGATGIDEAAEVRRIMSGRPPAVVMLAEPLTPWNQQSLAAVTGVLRREYRPALNVPEYGTRLIVYLRNGGTSATATPPRDVGRAPAGPQ